MSHAPYAEASSPRVLIAEDEEVVRRWLRRTLTVAGMRVLEAENGRQAMGLLAANAVDLVLTDLWMPKMNGVELIESVDRAGWQPRPDGRLPEIVVLSAHLTDASTGKLAGLGVFKTLTKPVETDVLVSIVEEALGGDRRARLQSKHDEESHQGSRDASAASAAVLIADDDPVVRAFVRKVLARSGYDVIEATDGEEAVEKALAHDIDLVLMDINMPRMNGRQAVEELKRATRDCFIICMTGECGQTEIDAVMRAGAMSCVRKPFEIDQLMGEVKRLDLIASHRRRMAARERERAEAEARWSLTDRTRSWVQAQEHRYRNRFKLVAGLVALIVIAAALAVPIVTAWTRAAADAARAAAQKMNNAVDAATRMEGYLQRDEQRELERRR